MAVNEGCGGAVTLCLARTRELCGAIRGYQGWGVGGWPLCTDIMNSGDGWSMGRHCDSVTVSGAPTAAAAAAAAKRRKKTRRDKGGERRESKLSAEKKRLRKGQRQ